MEVVTAEFMTLATSLAAPCSEPDRDCPLCPRLAAFRQEWRGREPGWHNAPVPSFGTANARLLIVGLAPGLRGANATGRPFTGDYAGDLLYRMLIAHGFAEGDYRARPDDGLRLKDCRITNAVRCVPPQNKPEPAEITRCRPFLETVIAEMPRLQIVLALGQIAHQSVVRAQGAPASRYPFRHGGAVALDAFTLVSSYHCSRYNTNTGVLTEAMFAAVFSEIRLLLGR
jgi:uracil-DNA glycosylase family 4